MKNSMINYKEEHQECCDYLGNLEIEECVESV